ncbi:heterokaryon incompatibility protein-domain-containing protein [Cercophora scortea]|uniref:Heterokaryon incompatibility protein-domain-containing protein n=1 Tax=Cercophora scortea TaxID=314031 RepID=A0AAE0M8S9_9PEZI|nr:heterokaryon incompatibility protein-domain-containing protein [Cercophora scortea]
MSNTDDNDHNNGLALGHHDANEKVTVDIIEETELSKLKSSCAVCKRLLQFALNVVKRQADTQLYKRDGGAQDPDPGDREIGTAEEVLSDDAPCGGAHKAFFNTFRRFGDSSSRRRLVGFTANNYFGRASLSYSFYEDEDERVWASVLDDAVVTVRGEGARQGLSIRRRMDGEYIDFGVVKQWRAYCEENHGMECSAATLQLVTPLAWLIDTQRHCLVPAPPGAAYIALSYVWGQTEILRTTSDNLAAHQVDGTIGGSTKTIPQTIRDAIGLVPLLGERYLWVDSLCIVQDDAESLDSHISQMAAIFENAVLVIVAGDGTDAEYGLRGIPNVSKPRALWPVLQLTDSIGIARRQTQRINSTTWGSRGWTVQEALFARRTLYFVGGSVRWSCRSTMYYEDVDAPLDADHGWPLLELGWSTRDIVLSLSSLNLAYPDLRKFFDLISVYACRKLTYDEDVFRAVASTLAVLRQPFPSGFVHGLPVSFLETSLLWRASVPPGLRRRKPSSNPALPQDLIPPSWTWAGWNGHLFLFFLSSEHYIKYPHTQSGNHYYAPYQAIPHLKWHTRTSKTADPIPIPSQNEWYAFKTQYMGKETGLPRGWTFHRESPETMQKFRAKRKDLCDQTGYIDPDCPVSYEAHPVDYFYTHETIPEIKFWHPIPLSGSTMNSTWPAAARDELEKEHVHGRYLCAKTHTARLWLSQPRHVPGRFGMDPVWLRPGASIVGMFSSRLHVETVLRDGEGREVGELSVDMEEDFRRVVQLAGEGDGDVVGSKMGLPCDIVALSRGFDFPEPVAVEDEVYTFYNVLWVVWEDGIAYRKGVGRVKRDVWEGMEKKVVDLVLG